MGTQRRRSISLKLSLSAFLSLWPFFLSTLNSQAFTVTTSHCISGLSPDELFSKASYLSTLVKIGNDSSMWRSVVQSWFLTAHINMLVASPLLSTGSILRISQHPDLKIVWHLQCLASFTEQICSTWLWYERSTISAASLSMLAEPVNGFMQYCKKFTAIKTPMINLQIQRLMLLLLSESTQDNQCVWSCELPLRLKDHMLQCFLSCQLHHLRYGNAEDQSYIGIATSDGLSDINAADQPLSNRGVQVKFIAVFTEAFQEFKMLIQHPLIAFTSTSLSTSLFHSSRIRKLAASSPLNLTNMEKFIQTSSRQGRERSILTSSLIKRIIPQPSLCVRGDNLLEIKTGKKNKSPSHLLSCVKVYLRPVDAATLISVGVEVLDDASTSQVNVTNRLLFEDFEVRFESFLDLIVSGKFDILHNGLSNFFKFVSPSLYFLELYVGALTYWFARRVLYEVAFSIVIV